MEYDAWFFVGVFVFIFIVWLAIGGPTRPISFTGPTLALPDELGGGTYLSFPRAPFGIGGSAISLPGSSGGRSSLSSLPALPGGSAFGTPSTYRDIISMNHYVSGTGSSDPTREYVQISVSSSAGVPVDITGWTLQSDATGNASPIPKGTETPTSGVVNAAQDIVLEPGNRAILISGQSPIGASFRENKCIGYFSAYQSFTPSLPQNCPDPSAELQSFYGASGYIRDGACVDYMKALPRCKPVLSPPPTLSGACQTFLIKYLTYNGCLDAHRNDADFLGDTWRIYLGRTNLLWRTRNELVKILDAKGDTVDAFSY